MWQFLECIGRNRALLGKVECPVWVVLVDALLEQATVVVFVQRSSVPNSLCRDHWCTAHCFQMKFFDCSIVFCIISDCCWKYPQTLSAFTPKTVLSASGQFPRKPLLEIPQHFFLESRPRHFPGYPPSLKFPPNSPSPRYSSWVSQQPMGYLLTFPFTLVSVESFRFLPSPFPGLFSFQATLFPFLFPWTTLLPRGIS